MTNTENLRAASQKVAEAIERLESIQPNGDPRFRVLVEIARGQLVAASSHIDEAVGALAESPRPVRFDEEKPPAVSAERTCSCVSSGRYVKVCESCQLAGCNIAGRHVCGLTGSA